MRPTHLKLTNFLSYRDTDIDFAAIAAATLTGDNGSGKSSLLDAITFALFGEGTRGGARQLDAYVTTGADECRVELTFILGGQTYRIVRHRSIARNKSMLELFIQDGDEWRALSGKNISDTDAQIAGLIRMNYRTFTASAFVLQGKADSLTADMTDHERKEVLASILGLDMWDRMLEQTREHSRSNRAEMHVLQVRAADLSGTATEAQSIRDRLQQARGELTTAQARLTEMDAELAQRQAQANGSEPASAQIADVRRQIGQAEDEQRALESDRSRATTIIAAADRVLAEGDTIKAAAKREAELTPQVHRMQQQADQYTALSRELETAAAQEAKWDRDITHELAGAAAIIERVKKQAELLGRVPCSGLTQAACQLLTAAREANAELPGLEERLARRRQETNPHAERCARLKVARAALTYDATAFERARRELDQVRLTARRMPELDAAVTRRDESSARIMQIDDRIVTLRESIEGLNGKREALLQRVQEASEARTLLDHLTRQAQSMQTQVTNRLIEIGQMEARLESAEQAATELAGIREKAAALADQQATLDVLEQACSKRGGVPALIVENAVPEIERLATDVLGRVSGGRLALRLDTQVEGKSTGTMQEVLRVAVLDGGAERSYQTYSGAERFMVDISLRVALSKFLSHRAGASIETLVIDEGFGSLDAANRQRIVEVLDIIRKDFALCLIITHLDELKEALPNRITVTKGARGSEVQVA